MNPHRSISISILISCLCFASISNCFDLLPMPCNLSLPDPCPAALYFAPQTPTTAAAAAALFSVASDAVAVKKSNRFLIDVSCACLADHAEYVWHAGYTVQAGDSWKSVGEKFGLLVRERPEKRLVPGTRVSLDVLCGCMNGAELVTYNIQKGDTLFVIGLRFGVDMRRIVEVNGIADPALIKAGDSIFIPVADPGHLTELDENDSNTNTSSKSRRYTILGIVIPAAIVTVIITMLLIWIYRRRKRQNRPKVVLGGKRSSFISRALPFCASKMSSLLDPNNSYEGSLPSDGSVKTIIFPYHEVRSATSKFSASLKIGQGSFGCVYRGRLRDVDVAVKQMKNTKSKEFFAELNILCKTYHNNLIKLLGYSAGAQSLFLVYEFAENGALSEHLHNPAIRGHKPLSWSKRLHIALDVAKGLEYIHVYIKPFCVHRDVKTSNILLDSNFRAKIADFGLVKLLEQSSEGAVATTKLVGTFGYLAPEYVREGCVTPKGDVYAYGVVLMELVTGQPALSRNENAGDELAKHRTVVDYMLSALEVCHDSMTAMAKIVDPNLIHYHKGSLHQMALLSKDCVADDSEQRPDMSQVVLHLSKIVENMEQDEISNAPRLS